MLTGTIRWYRPDKSYGFIIPDDGSRDVFLHNSILRAAGYENLKPGTPVEFESIWGASGKGPECVRLNVLSTEGEDHGQEKGTHAPYQDRR